ncbi:MAG: phosphatase PAP2 family protein [Candidatus Caenarcaniphilales bacterium]|nr:phosphatase PAP2 family protein [Candidatus Caenarcaniphilales bacterium]
MILFLLRKLINKNLPWYLLFIIVFFVSFAKLDLMIAKLFYKEGAFFLINHPFCVFIHLYFPKFIAFTAIAILVIWLIGRVVNKDLLGIDFKVCLFTSSVVLLGPVLIVNSFFKEFWGRPRPIQIVEFGGPMNFAPPWYISGQCPHNCSFTSGEASGAFWFFALALLTPPKWRALAVDLAFFVGIIVSFVRLAQGGHFFSDVFFSGLIMILLSLGFYRLIFGEEKFGELLTYSN